LDFWGLKSVQVPSFQGLFQLILGFLLVVGLERGQQGMEFLLSFLVFFQRVLKMEH
jgi:hypothetical protein